MTKLEKIQEKLKEKLIENPELIVVADKSWLTQEICEQCMATSYYEYFSSIPQEFITKEMAEAAVDANSRNIIHVPHKFITDEMMKPILIKEALTLDVLKYDPSDFINRPFLNEDFAKKALTPNTELNKKLSTRDKSIILNLYPKTKSICTELDVIKGAWNIYLQKKLYIKENENSSVIRGQRFTSRDEDPTFVYGQSSNKANLLDRPAYMKIFESDLTTDLTSRYSEIKNLDVEKVRFLADIHPDIKKEVNAYIDSGEAGLQKYYEEINNEANYVYTNKGKLLSDDLIEMILNGEHVEVLDTEEFECTFYHDEYEFYDYAKVSLEGKDYIMYINSNTNTIVGITDYKEGIIPEEAYVIKYLDDMTYDVIEMATLYNKGFEILDGSNYKLNFKYNNTDYEIEVNSDFEETYINLYEKPFNKTTLTPEELIRHLDNDANFFKDMITKAKEFIKSKEQQQNIGQEK